MVPGFAGAGFDIVSVRNFALCHGGIAILTLCPQYEISVISGEVLSFGQLIQPRLCPELFRGNAEPGVTQMLQVIHLL